VFKNIWVLKCFTIDVAALLSAALPLEQPNLWRMNWLKRIGNPSIIIINNHHHHEQQQQPPTTVLVMPANLDVLIPK
jgi:hypothetical protein